MLWHKAWLETRWRFISALVILTILAGGNVYDYVATQELLPRLNATTATPAAEATGIAGAIREAIEVQKDFRGFIWYQTLPVTRKQWLGARTGTGIAELLAISIIPPLAISVLAPTIGQRFSVIDALAHGVCIFFVATVFFSLASFLSTLFGDIWRPMLTAIGIACVVALASILVPQLSIFSVMNGESYFRTGSLPWAGMLASAVISLALLYSAAETLERRDF
jgi:hypothetical protein